MELLSLPFFFLCLGSGLWLINTRGRLRAAGYTAACVAFAYGYLGPLGLLSTLSLCAAGYACAVAAPRGRAALWGGVALLTAAFVVLRGYFFVPEGRLAQIFATAGLSFLFFKLVHVVVDSGSGTLPPLRPWTFLNYCLSFTAFLLGPIQRYGDFARQWSGEVQAIEPAFEAHLDAVNRILRGLVKKYVLAEYLADIALGPGADVERMSARALLLGVYAFYFLLYCDFSGYCDVVIGAGMLIGLRPPENFRLPFLAPNVADFWLRVHRSLTLWLTDYVFNPTLAALLRARGAKKSPLPATALALMLTMAVSGIWHGTTLNFLCFGLLHGAYLVVYRVGEHLALRRLGRQRLKRLRARPWWRLLGIAVTFNATAVAFLFFVLDAQALGRLVGRLAP